MKQKLTMIDSLLNAIEVRGESVILLAQARQLLKELYDQEENDG